MSPEQKPFRVLCLDGGGMRGLYTACVLDVLSKRFHNSQEVDVGKAFDLIVGTSTGGLLAIALAHGVPLAKIIDLYQSKGEEIFPHPTPKQGLVSWAIWLAKRKKQVKKGKDALQRELETLLGTTTIEELYKERGIALCIPSVRMQSQKAWVFKTPHNPKKNRDNKYKLVDVCLATSAAPMILPLHAIDVPDGVGHDVFADGGLWANNPMLVGVIEAASMIKTGQPIEVLSISTGSPPEGHIISKQQTNWGIEDWVGGVEIANTAMNAQASDAEEVAKFLQSHINGLRVCRLPHTSPSQRQHDHIGMDKSSQEALTALIDMARTDAQNIHSQAIAGGNGGFHSTVREIFEAMKPHLNQLEEERNVASAS